MANVLENKGETFAATGVLLLTLMLLAFNPCICQAEGGGEAPPALASWPAELRDQLRQPGVSTFSKGALNNVVIRGYQRENIMVLFDGAPFFGASPVRADAPPFHLNPPDIARIAITRGPYNLAYPGGAGGTVEVMGPANGQGVKGRASLTHGSSDAASGSAYLSVAGEQADLGGGYAYRTSHVPESADGRLLTAVTYPNPRNNYRDGAEDRTMFRNQTAWLRGGVSPTSQSRFDVAYTYQEGEAMLTPTLSYDLPYEEAHRMTGRFTLQEVSPLIAQLLVQGWIGRASCIMDDALRETANPATSPSVTRSYASRLDLTADTTGGKAEARLNLGDSTLQSGVDFYQRDWRGDYSWLKTVPAAPSVYLDDQILIPDASTRNLGLYGIWETPLTGSLRLVAALRGDFSRITADGITPALTNFYQAYHGNRAIPREQTFSTMGANAQLQYVPAAGMEFFFKAGQGGRLPDTHEMYLTQVRQGSNLVGNPFINAPLVREADAGFRFSSERAGLEATFFYSDVRDYILPRYVYAETLGKAGRTAANVDARIRGVEAEGYLRLSGQVRLGGGSPGAGGRTAPSACRWLRCSRFGGRSPCIMTLDASLPPLSRTWPPVRIG